MAGDHTIEFKASLSNKQVIAPTYRPMPARPITTVAVDTDTVSDRLESWGESDELPTSTSIGKLSTSTTEINDFNFNG
jgi:hypothetical protein